MCIVPQLCCEVTFLFIHLVSSYLVYLMRDNNNTLVLLLFYSVNQGMFLSTSQMGHMFVYVSSILPLPSPLPYTYGLKDSIMVVKISNRLIR
jgi:hypothetical protein